MHTYFTVTAKQISTLQGTSYETSRKEWHRLRKLLEIPEGEPLRLRDVAAAWGADVEVLATALYFKKAKLAA